MSAPKALWHTDLTAVDVFAGYLVLDAWVANLDRHEENWAVLRDTAGGLSLAPSYDRGAALGSSLSEERRRAYVADPAKLEAYAAKGFALKFEDGGKVPKIQLTSVAADALDAAASAARELWLDRLAAVGAQDCGEAFAGVPRMSDAARTFSIDLLMINRRRVLDVCR